MEEDLVFSWGRGKHSSQGGDPPPGTWGPEPAPEPKSRDPARGGAAAFPRARSCSCTEFGAEQGQIRAPLSPAACGSPRSACAQGAGMRHSQPSQPGTGSTSSIPVPPQCRAGAPLAPAETLGQLSPGSWDPAASCPTDPSATSCPNSPSRRHARLAQTLLRAGRPKYQVAERPLPETPQLCRSHRHPPRHPTVPGASRNIKDRAESPSWLRTPRLPADPRAARALTDPLLPAPSCDKQR